MRLLALGLVLLLSGVRTQLCDRDQELAMMVVDDNSWLKAALPNNDNMDELVDFALLFFDAGVRFRHQDVVSIPDWKEEFRVKKLLGLIKVRCQVTARQGWFGHLHTLTRLGHSSVVRSSDSLSATIGLYLTDMEVGYRDLRLKASSFRFHGSIEAKVGRNAMEIVVNMTAKEGGACDVKLHSLRVTQLTNFKVKMQGSNRVVNWLLTKVAKNLLKKGQTKNMLALGNALFSTLQSTISAYHCQRNAK